MYTDRCKKGCFLMFVLYSDVAPFYLQSCCFALDWKFQLRVRHFFPLECSNALITPKQQHHGTDHLPGMQKTDK